MTTPDARRQFVLRVALRRFPFNLALASDWACLKHLASLFEAHYAARPEGVVGTAGSILALHRVLAVFNPDPNAHRERVADAVAAMLTEPERAGHTTPAYRQAVTTLFELELEGCRARAWLLLQHASPLYIYAFRGMTASLAMLASAGVALDGGGVDQPEVGDAWRTSPLWAAAYQGHAAAVWELVRAGAPLDAGADDCFGSPLTVACRYGHHAAAAILVHAGARVASPAPVAAACTGRGPRQARLLRWLLGMGAELGATPPRPACPHLQAVLAAAGPTQVDRARQAGMLPEMLVYVSADAARVTQLRLLLAEGVALSTQYVPPETMPASWPVPGSPIAVATAADNVQAVQLLVLYGAAFAPPQPGAATPGPNVRAWMAITMGQSPLQRALALTPAVRFPIDVTGALRHDRLHPEAEPWRPANPALLGAMGWLARNAQRGWSPGRHHLYPDRFAVLVFSVLLVARRLASQQGGQVGHLPPEMWHAVLGLLARRDAPALVPAA